MIYVGEVAHPWENHERSDLGQMGDHVRKGTEDGCSTPFIPSSLKPVKEMLFIVQNLFTKFSCNFFLKKTSYYYLKTPYI